MPAYECFVLDLVPNRFRGEFMCAGVLAIGPQGPIVRLTLETSRAKALHPDMAAFNPTVWQEDLEQVLSEIPRDTWSMIIGGPEGLVARQPAGSVVAENAEALPEAVEAMSRALTTLPRAVVKPARAAPQTRLQQQLRSWLRGARLFSANAADINKSRVVSNYPISAEADLFADFALMNGTLNVIETIDLRGAERLSRASRNEAGFKALLLDQVRSNDAKSKRIAVFAADDYAIARPAMSLVGRYASDVIAIDSAEDRDRLASFVTNSLHLQTLLAPPTQH